eukprot:scaffold4157_cov136-Cylindrotheca_fusiformis.AAC.5
MSYDTNDCRGRENGQESCLMGKSIVDCYRESFCALQSLKRNSPDDYVKIVQEATPTIASCEVKCWSNWSSRT